MSIAVIIPSRKAENLGPCLRAIRKHEPDAYILVVDDGIDWDKIPAEERPASMPGAKPFGYARNVNRGIRSAGMVVGIDHIVLCNDDCQLLRAGGFSHMAKLADENPNYGVISAVCRAVGNPNQNPQTVGFRQEPKSLCFVCVLIPRGVFDKVGLLDEQFGGYATCGRKIYGFEDDDYSRRVLNAGLKLGIDDYCRVDHESLVSTFRGDPRDPIDLSIGEKLYLEKWGQWEAANALVEAKKAEVAILKSK